MDKTLTESVDEVVQNLNNSKPHEIPSHAVVYGTNVRDGQNLPFTLLLNSLAETSEIQMQGFGAVLKNWGIHAEIVVLVVNGLMPDLFLHPVSIVLGMSRSGDYEQRVVDHFKGETLPSENITDEDKAICAALFLGQVMYKPEQQGAIWN